MAKTVDHDKHNDALRQRSGTVRSVDPIVSLLYSLLRDHVPAGILEELVREIEDGATGETRYTNGYLAKYAQDLALRLARCNDRM